MKKIFTLIAILLLAGKMISLAQPVLYGLTSQGGQGIGTISKFEASTNTLSAAYTFQSNPTNPSQYGTQVYASNGKLYGMTSGGGSFNRGTIYSIDPNTNSLTKLYDFNGVSGSSPSGGIIQASNGLLYGLTSYGGQGVGTIFSFDPVSNALHKVHDFNTPNGSVPFGALVQIDNGKLYGMTLFGGTSGRGTIFCFDPVTQTYTKLHDFNNSTGVFPYGSLVQASNGKLYGMTNSGGNNNFGTIFSFDPSTNTFAKLLDFNNTNGNAPYGSLVVSGGRLYGMTFGGGTGSVGTIFSFDPTTNAYTKLHNFNYANGGYPYGSLTVSNGTLYGMTSQGGIIGRGIIFAFNPTTNILSKLYDFNNANGNTPYGSLVEVGSGKLYGTTPIGVNGSPYGTIFSFDPLNSGHTTVFEFSHPDGGYVYGKLSKYDNGKLYGMTQQRGSFNYGTIFSFDPLTNTHVKLHDFNGMNGASPGFGSLVESGEKLYGMTAGGGSSGNGTIFSFDPTTNTHAKLLDFNNTSGRLPYGSLTASRGKLYGMTYGGGSSSNGTIFSFDPATNTHVKVHDFNNTNGSSPYGSLVESSGKLYGMTFIGGNSGYGTIFSFDPATNTHVKVHDFDNTNGSYPYGSLVMAGNGKLYGMTSQGGMNSRGTIFSFDPTTNTHVKLYDFDYSNGSNPRGSFLVSSFGLLYGMTLFGGNSGYGTVFSFDFNTNTFTKLQDFNGSNGAVPDFGSTFIEVNTCMPTTEVCDGVDNDCDGQIDEDGNTTFYQDNDGDGFGNPAVTIQACAAPAGYVDNNTDCDDANAAIKPGAPEVCDGIDNDCDGNIDEGVLNTYYLDNDSDGYGDPAKSIQACSAPAGYVSQAGDCFDNNTALNPGIAEICDGIDNNCDGQIDEGLPLLTWYQDSDGDGKGSRTLSVQNCGQPSGYVGNNDDCDDQDNTIYVGAPEVCDGKDNDCDGEIDNGVLVTYYLDADGDGFGLTNTTTQACSQPAGYSASNGDCDDTKASVYPGATEVCNGFDDDCDGEIDEGLTFVTYYRDEDGDGYGDATQSQSSCSALVGYVTQAGDCDDNNAAINPAATEVCNGIDDDCDGDIDEGVKLTFYQDGDGDGFGNLAITTLACAAPQGYVSNSTDCDDTKASVYPGATEVCNGIDDDCDGEIDEGLTFVTYYRDQDGDGYGDATQYQSSCSTLVGYVTQAGDCNDNNNAVNPAATEICDGLDNDCDGEIDEGVKLTFYRDSDGDGYGNLAITTLACTAPAGYVSNSTDCNDQVASIYPGATEIMCNGIDDDCDGLVDEDIVQTTSRVIITQSSTQYSDQVSLTAELEPAVANGGCQAATHVTFRIGTKLIGTFPLQLSGNKLSATTNVTLYETLGSSDYSPGNKTVTATFSGVNAAFNVNNPSGTLTITKEDARVNYTGALFASTTCQTCSNASVTLSATIQDISATSSAGGDNLSGDIRLARVRFVNRDNGSPISGWLNPGLVSSSDLRTGTVTFNWNVNIGSADAEQYTVGIEVEGYYNRNLGSDNAVVNIAKPLNDFVTGGGFILASNSAGRYASDPGTKNNFGFNVKYNKSGKNLQGKLNFIVRRTESGVLKTYQIKGNVMTSLSIQGGTPAKAVYNGKANITDITNPLAPVALGGNMTLQVEMTDRGEPGSSDSYALTVWMDDGGLAYSSNWTGTRSAEQVLAGGNLQVRGSAAKVSAPGMDAGPMLDQEMAPMNARTPLQVKVLPNPSPNRFTLNLSGGSNEPIQLRVTDILGRVVEGRKLPAGAQTVQVGDGWINGSYILEVIQGTERKTVQLVKLK